MSKNSKNSKSSKSSLVPYCSRSTDMFSRQQRLSGKAARFVIRRGRGLSGSALRIKWVPARTPESRATIVVGLVVDKRATVRNRTKRRIREGLRPVFSRFQFPVHLIVSTNKGAAERSFQELHKELIELLQRARLLK